MSIDLTQLLRDWPYESGQINVRLIQGDDGEPKIQMRLDLGLLQMESTGRPDGNRPHGCESLLEYHETVRDETYAEATLEDGEEDQDDLDPEDAEFALTSEDCRLLREEAVQYYHRYISLLVIGDFVGVLRDTTRNLRVIELCAEHAEDDADREVLEQFRPYITMMRVRAIASQMIADEEPRAAMWALDRGINQIRELYEQADRIEDFERSPEFQLLSGMRDELIRKLPASQRAELRSRLEEAIRNENYELAAILRDEIRMLKDDSPPRK